MADVSNPEGALVNFLRLKTEFRRLFPPGHPVRSLIEAEPDEVPRREGLAKLELLARLICALRRSSR